MTNPYTKVNDNSDVSDELKRREAPAYDDTISTAQDASFAHGWNAAAVKANKTIKRQQQDIEALKEKLETAEKWDIIESQRNEELKQELEALRNPWVAVSEFEKTAYEGWIWIVYKGRVTEAYRDHNYLYRFNRWSENVYMVECITHVLLWPLPEAPKAEGE